jgi:Family of unknown function (DUF6328)
VAGRRERSGEDLDRELIELLNELRVALPGVQVLFAFLLVLPFQRRFETLSDGDRAVYFAAFTLTALASALLIAPSAHHRVRWRAGDKEHLLRSANRLVIAGSVCLAAAISCSVYLITDVLYGTATAVAVAITAGAVYAWFWYGLPLARRATE